MPAPAAFRHHRSANGGAEGGVGFDYSYADQAPSSSVLSILLCFGKLVYLSVVGLVQIVNAAVQHPLSAVVTATSIALTVVYVYRTYMHNDNADVHTERCVAAFPAYDPSQSPYTFLQRMYEWVVRYGPPPQALSRVGFGTKEHTSWRGLSHVMGPSQDHLLARENLESSKRDAARALKIDPRVFHLNPRPTLQTMLSIQAMARGARGRQVDVVRRTLELDVMTVWDVVSAARRDGELLPSDLASTMSEMLVGPRPYDRNTE